MALDVVRYHGDQTGEANMYQLIYIYVLYTIVMNKKWKGQWMSDIKCKYRNGSIHIRCSCICSG